MSFDLYKDDYRKLWETCEIRPERMRDIEITADKVMGGRRHYEAIAGATGVPWWFIGFLHFRESNCDFGTHLHNGDPLRAKTRNVPPNRPPWKPRNGKSYTFEESAEDALGMKGLATITDWSIERICFEAERYNGFGYRGRGKSQRSPYLWGGTNQQKPGKYIADGVYSASHMDVQPGVCAVLKLMLEREPNLLATSDLDEIAKSAPKAGPVADTHTEAHTLLKQESTAYASVNNILKGIGLPVSLGGAGTAAAAEGGLAAWSPAIGFVKAHGLKMAVAIVGVIIALEIYQVIQRQKKLT